MSPSTSLTSFDAIHDFLITTYPAPLLPPGKSHSAALTASIAALSVHPTLEAALHILNADLPSAHFLVRHMQATPAHEGMYLHGILHRIEGDYDNARAWYGDVADSEVFRKAWQSKKEALDFVGRVEKLKKHGDGDRQALEGESRREIEAVVSWCIVQFGTQPYEDATEAWVQPSDKIKKMGQDQVSGDAGRRQF
ncbi:MAG: hypothetical protein M1817_004720 [Caeruleum heppii]|nr:MAG: hypothetical protein M1817_004720 [Caeruleum heppii]